jgi:hypothetical protein
MFPHKAKPAVAAAGRAPRNGHFVYNPHPTTTCAENQGFPGVFSPKTARKQPFYCKWVGLAICSLIGVLRSLFKAQVPVWGKMQVAIAPSILHRNSPPFYYAYSPQPSLSAGRDPPGQDGIFDLNQPTRCVQQPIRGTCAPSGLAGCVIMPPGGQLLSGSIHPKRRSNMDGLQTLAWLLVLIAITVSQPMHVLRDGWLVVETIIHLIC